MMDTGACTRTSKRNKVKKMNQMKMGNFTVWEENVVNQKVLLSISGPNENFFFGLSGRLQLEMHFSSLTGKTRTPHIKTYLILAHVLMAYMYHVN